jgi:hypothetical protein
MFKAGAIDKESLIELLDPPMKQQLLERLKKAEQNHPQGGGNVTPMPAKDKKHG